MTPGSTLNAAHHLITSDRQADYGDPMESLDRIRQIFAVASGLNLSRSQVACFMVCVKLARQRHRFKDDNCTDGAAYFDLWAVAASTEHKPRSTPVMPPVRPHSRPVTPLTRRLWDWVIDHAPNWTLRWCK